MVIFMPEKQNVCSTKIVPLVFPKKTCDLCCENGGLIFIQERQNAWSTQVGPVLLLKEDEII